jgi:hypothetical protein
LFYPHQFEVWSKRQKRNKVLEVKSGVVDWSEVQRQIVRRKQLGAWILRLILSLMHKLELGMYKVTEPASIGFRILSIYIYI